MYGAVQTNDFGYDNATDSLMFGIKYYNPDGGPFVEMLKNQPLSVILDVKLYTQASVKIDGKIYMKTFFCSPANHQVQLNGLRILPNSLGRYWGPSFLPLIFLRQ
ncbi:MAG: hypothetical protein WAM14_24555 [Candidatus Nitrosopolaris sp.]